MGKEEELAGGGVDEGEGVGAGYGGGDVGEVVGVESGGGGACGAVLGGVVGVSAARGGGEGAEDGGEVGRHSAGGLGDEKCDGVAAALRVGVVVLGGGRDPAGAGGAVVGLGLPELAGRGGSDEPAGSSSPHLGTWPAAAREMAGCGPGGGGGGISKVLKVPCDAASVSGESAVLAGGPAVTPARQRAEAAVAWKCGA